MPDITVRILEARNLLAADRGGTSDPYTIVRVDSIKHKTKVIKKCLNPKWMETFKFTVLNPKSTKVVIEVWDKDTFKKDDPLGCLSISLSGLEKGVEKLEWYNLNGVPKGQLYVGITADNFDTITPALKSNYPSSSIQQNNSPQGNPQAYNSDPFASYPPQNPQAAYPPQLYSSQPNYSAGGYPPSLNYPPPMVALPQQYGSNLPPSPYPPQPNPQYPPQQYGSNLPPQPNAYPPQSNPQLNYPPQQYGSNLPPQPNAYPPQSNPPYSSQTNYPPQPMVNSSQQYGSNLPPSPYPPQPNPQSNYNPYNSAPQNYPPM